jgi:hypothetical protein
MSEYTTQQAVEFAFNGDANSFKTAIDDILLDKISAAVELKKIQVASTFLNQEEDQQGDTNDD